MDKRGKRWDRLRHVVRGFRGAARAIDQQYADVASELVMPSKSLVPAARSALGRRDDSLYVAFEDRFYDHDTVNGFMRFYVELLTERLPLVDGRRPVVDIGAGRGELLEQLIAAGLDATGVEINTTEVGLGFQRGLPLVQGDAVGHLETLDDASLAGVTLIQVIEHLQPDYFKCLIELLAAKVVHGGIVVIETVNSRCPLAHGDFWLDLTHVRPYPAEMVEFYLAAAGFSESQLVYRNPLPPQFRLADVPEATYYNYAIVATR